MLLYMGLLAMFLAMLTSLFTAIVDVQLESEGTSALEQDSRYIYSRLAYDIGRSGAIVEPAIPGQSSSTLTLTINNAPVTYTVSGGNLVRTSGATSDALNSIGSRISTISFLRLGNTGGKPTIQMTGILNSVSARSGGAETRTLTASFGLR